MYPHQLERLTGALAAGKCDALVATTAANIAYLTDWRSLVRTVDPAAPVMAVFAPGGTALVIPRADAPAVADAHVDVAHVVPFGRGRTPGAALAVALEALGVRRGTVALDEAGITAPVARELTATLTNHTIVPGDETLLAARQVKGPWEIEALERTLIIAEEALNAVIQVLAPGVTERAAVELFEAEIRKRDAMPRCPLITFGARTALSAVATSDRALRTGDLVRLDVGCVWRGYHADVARTAVMGAPAPRQEKVFDAVVAGLQAGIAAVRPGTVIGDVVSAAVASARGAGLPDYDPDDLGHGIGLDARERPRVASASAAPLETAMVMRLETAFSETGWGGVQVADTVLVTTSDVRVMNRSRHGLLVLD